MGSYIAHIAQNKVQEIAEQLDLSLSDEWKLSVNGIFCKKELVGPISESNNIQFEQKIDTMREHYDRYKKMYTPTLITPDIVTDNAPTLPEVGRNEYIIKVEVDRKMPEYELIIGENNKGVEPIKFFYAKGQGGWAVEEDMGKRKFIISFSINAEVAQKQCRENGFAQAFDIRDSEGRIIDNGLECLTGKLKFYVKVKGKDGIYESDWSPSRRYQFKCQ